MGLFTRRTTPAPQRRRTDPTATTDAQGDTAYLFRRGRTLTGSASSHVRTLREAQADLKSSRVHAHGLARRRRRLGGILGGVVVLALACYIAITQFTAEAVVRASPDTSLQLGPEYSEAIDAYFGDYLSQRWRFLTDDERLTAHVQMAVPEVKTIATKGSAGFGKTLFEITFREPIASWDIEDRELYVDTNGIPFSRNYFGAPPLRITDQSGMSAALSGQSVMSNRFMSFIGQVIGESEKQGYVVQQIVIPEGMTRQINVYLEGIVYPFKFSSDRSAGEGVDDMVRAHQWMKARSLTPEYVDVRVSGKVFYR